MAQRDEQWWADKLGKVGSSKISAVMAGGKGVTRRNYMVDLLYQRLNHKYKDSYKNDSIDWGTESESLARCVYEVEEIDGFPHPTIPMCGASPDGLVMENGKVIGLLEIKCPDTTTHIDFVHDSKIPRQYELQMTWQMICAGQKWCDYVSYDPRIPGSKNYKCVRFYYDEKLACEITEAVVQFLSELDELEKEFK